jgi:hypothetical protein
VIFQPDKSLAAPVGMQTGNQAGKMESEMGSSLVDSWR